MATATSPWSSANGGVITALLTLAEVTGAEWVACARTDAERQLVAEQYVHLRAH
jgi:hypothetical protein